MIHSDAPSKKNIDRSPIIIVESENERTQASMRTKAEGKFSAKLNLIKC